jgi:voltage-gated potassium channel Kch
VARIARQASPAADASDRDLIERAGISRVASVLLTTNDDAMNIYLAVYCRKLNPDLRIVSRITHERNVEAIHRAGADFVLSYTSLGVDNLMSLISGTFANLPTYPPHVNLQERRAACPVVASAEADERPD